MYRFTASRGLFQMVAVTKVTAREIKPRRCISAFVRIPPVLEARLALNAGQPTIGETDFICLLVVHTSPPLFGRCLHMLQLQAFELEVGAESSTEKAPPAVKCSRCSRCSWRSPNPHLSDKGLPLKTSQNDMKQGGSHPSCSHTLSNISH